MVLVGLVMGAAGLGQVLGIPAVLAALLSTALGAGLWVLSKRRDRPRHRIVGFCIAMVMLLGLSATAWSYTGYLTAPGSASVPVRTSDWMRDHGMSPIVDRLEQRIYGGPGPSNGQVAAGELPAVHAVKAGVPATQAASSTISPAPAGGLIDASLPGEGVWTPSDRVVGGSAVTYTAFVRPDPANEWPIGVDGSERRVSTTPGR